MLLHYYFILFSVFLSVFCELLSKPEGAQCEHDNATGICIKIYKCQYAHIFLKTKEFPPICSFEGKDPIVCCTDCHTVDDIRKIVFNPGVGLLPLTGRKAHDKCVNYVDQLDYSCKTRGNFSRQLDHDLSCYRLRFTAGSKRPPHEESYLALLGYGGDKNTAEWRCAGTIISENFIITAAHCLVIKPLGPVKYVAVGITNRLDTSEWQIYDVQKDFSHPDYETNFKYHDIALIKTESIKFNQHVLPACLHSDPETFDASEAGILVWNSTDEVLDQGKLQVFPLDEFDEVQCSFFYPPHPELPSGFDASSQICYGDVRTPQDSCQSDSGSPLVLYRRRAFRCTRFILGVMSIDRNCGTWGSSGMFTKVIHYIPWIESIVWP